MSTPLRAGQPVRPVGVAFGVGDGAAVGTLVGSLIAVGALVGSLIVGGAVVGAAVVGAAVVGEELGVPEPAFDSGALGLGAFGSELGSLVGSRSGVLS